MDILARKMFVNQLEKLVLCTLIVQNINCAQLMDYVTDLKGQFLAIITCNALQNTFVLTMSVLLAINWQLDQNTDQNQAFLALVKHPMIVTTMTHV